MAEARTPVETAVRRRIASLLIVVGTLVGALMPFASDASAQEGVRLSAGDSIRVDGDIVGRVLSIEGQTMTVVSRAAPRCRAGEMHGDAPICDPAPLVRHTMAVDEVLIERRSEKPHLMARTVIGGVLGAGAFGAAGYFIGPSIGFGRVDGCLLNASAVSCATGERRYTQAEIDARQKSSDQQKGAFFFGVIGGTATAILVNKLSKGWVRVEPIVTAGDPDSWGLSLHLPAFN